MTKLCILFRSDASTQIGTGHIMRCLALAQAAQDADITVHFASASLPDGLATRLTDDGMVLHQVEVLPGSHSDAMYTVALAQDLGAAWIVVDGYHFGAAYQRLIKDAGLKLLAIDDYSHAESYAADLVLNQNSYADLLLYPSCEPYTRLLLGSRYTLLRREFLRWCDCSREISTEARNILLTMGGSDPENITLKVFEALEQVDLQGKEVVVVVGASNPHFQVLEAIADRSIFDMRLLHNVTNMPEVMAWADVAVTSGGSTCWELAFMGVPSLILVLADNQVSIAEDLDRRGVSKNLGDAHATTSIQIRDALSGLLSNVKELRQMGALGRQLIDGYGTRRVVTMLKG